MLLAFNSNSNTELVKRCYSNSIARQGVSELMNSLTMSLMMSQNRIASSC